MQNSVGDGDVLDLLFHVIGETNSANRVEAEAFVFGRTRNSRPIERLQLIAKLERMRPAAPKQRLALDLRRFQVRIWAWTRECCLASVILQLIAKTEDSNIQRINAVAAGEIDKAGAEALKKQEQWIDRLRKKSR